MTRVQLLLRIMYNDIITFIHTTADCSCRFSSDNYRQSMIITINSRGQVSNNDDESIDTIKTLRSPHHIHFMGGKKWRVGTRLIPQSQMKLIFFPFSKKKNCTHYFKLLFLRYLKNLKQNFKRFNSTKRSQVKYSNEWQTSAFSRPTSKFQFISALKKVLFLIIQIYIIQFSLFFSFLISFQLRMITAQPLLCLYPTSD